MAVTSYNTSMKTHPQFWLNDHIYSSIAHRETFLEQTFFTRWTIQSCRNFLSDRTLQLQLHIHAGLQHPLHVAHALLKSCHVCSQIINHLPFLLQIRIHIQRKQQKARKLKPRHRKVLKSTFGMVWCLSKQDIIRILKHVKDGRPPLNIKLDNNFPQKCKILGTGLFIKNSTW